MKTKSSIESSTIPDQRAIIQNPKSKRKVVRSSLAVVAIALFSVALMGCDPTPTDFAKKATASSYSHQFNTIASTSNVMCNNYTTTTRGNPKMNCLVQSGTGPNGWYSVKITPHAHAPGRSIVMTQRAGSSQLCQYDFDKSGRTISKWSNC